MNLVFAVFMAATAYFFLSFGFVLQKKGIGWMKKNLKRDKEFYKNLATWGTGFIIMNMYGIPSAIALKILQPHIVAAFAGWGIIVMVFFSNILLKEKIYKTDYYYSLLIISGILFITLFRNAAAPEPYINSPALYSFFIFPAFLFAAGFAGKKNPWIKTILFASASGSAAGVMIVALKLLVAGYDYRVAEYFNSPFIYVYIIAALLSLVALQFALKNGLMIIVGPVQYSSNIIYPVIGSYFVFNQNLNIIQLLSISIIIFSIIKILKKH